MDSFPITAVDFPTQANLEKSLHVRSKSEKHLMLVTFETDMFLWSVLLTQECFRKPLSVGQPCKAQPLYCVNYIPKLCWLSWTWTPDGLTQSESTFQIVFGKSWMSCSTASICDGLVLAHMECTTSSVTAPPVLRGSYRFMEKHMLPSSWRLFQGCEEHSSPILCLTTAFKGVGTGLTCLM